jgi:hypothetical protein
MLKITMEVCVRLKWEYCNILWANTEGFGLQWGYYSSFWTNNDDFSFIKLQHCVIHEGNVSVTIGNYNELFLKGWKYYNYLWTYNDGFYFSMKVLQHVMKTIVKFCVTWDEGIAFRSGVLSILFQYFLSTYLFYFFPYRPTSCLNPMTFFKYSFTSILEGNGGKTQNLIIYKWANAHVQNIS